MNLPKPFNEYIKEGIVKKQSPDVLRAKSLIKEAEKSYEFIKDIKEKIGINKNNTNTIIKDAYDIIIELIRAKMLKAGFKSSGIGAHEAEVSYLRELGFKDTEIEFTNQLRYFRNGILYYGKSFDIDYVNKVLDFLNKVYRLLSGLE